MMIAVLVLLGGHSVKATISFSSVWFGSRFVFESVDETCASVVVSSSVEVDVKALVDRGVVFSVDCDSGVDIEVRVSEFVETVVVESE